MIRQIDSNETCDIYILKCENNKFYVGKTNSLEHRIQQHFRGSGAQWTRQHKPINVVRIYRNRSSLDETFVTLQLMIKYGIHSVRGGPYCCTIFLPYTIKSIIKSICSENYVCSRCCNSDHVINNCSNNTWKCVYCNISHHSFEKTYCDNCGYETRPINTLF